MAHAAQVVQPGKTFLRRMLETKATRGRSKGMVRLNLGFRSDMAWWAVFLESWNGTSMIECRRSDKGGVVQIWTDASGGWGCGL